MVYHLDNVFHLLCLNIKRFMLFLEQNVNLANSLSVSYQETLDTGYFVD